MNQLELLKEGLAWWLTLGFFGSALILILLGSYSPRHTFAKLMSSLGFNIFLSLTGPVAFAVLAWTAAQHIFKRRKSKGCR